MNDSTKEIALQLIQISNDLNYLKNNLFVYNKLSCPVRLQKYIRNQLVFSSEVAAILLPDVTRTAKNKHKNISK